MTFRELYDENFRFVWRSLRRLGVAEADTADAVQDVFVVVHRRLPEYEGRGKLTTWLFGICMRVASDRRRLAHVRRELLTGGEELPSAKSERPRADTDAHDARAILESILDRMPEEQRIVFVLFELEGMTGDEIAEILSLPEGTVRSRLRLARGCFQESVARLHRRDASWPNLALRHREV